MDGAGKKSARGSKGNCASNSEFDALIEHIEKNGNCEFLRILEQFSKMNGSEKKKFISFATKLTE